jgi:Rne/Rng family ribonuclease
MAKEICISTTPHETRLAILENDELAEIYYERENEYTLAGSIYKGRVTRVLPGMQSAFVDIGLERDAFLYVTDFMEEQEDSDEFERTSLPNGGSRDQSRREGRGRQPQSEAAAPEPAAAPAREEESSDTEAPSGTRRWRGRRGRGRGMRRGREGARERETHGQDAREPLSHDQLQQQSIEPGSEETVFDAPVIDVRIDENEAAFERHSPAAATPGRILLPGESLSKYGGKPAAEAPQAQAATSAPAFKPSYTAPKPSTLVEVPLTWDGSSLLPGESRAGRRTAPLPVPVAQPEPESAADTAPEAVAETHEIPTTDPIVVEAPTETHVKPVADAEAAPAAEPAPMQAVAPHEETEEEEIHEEIHEFDPEQASASHRVETAAPSEFRIPSVVEEAEEEDEETSGFAPAVDEHTDAPAHEAAAEHDEQAAEVPDQLFGFAPGAGILEEEVIDEDEYDFEPIHSHVDEHDSEDLEEETLEHTGSEISDIVRDEHIDQRLATEPGVLESESNGEHAADFEVTEEGFDDEESPDETEEAVTADGAAPARERDRGRRGRRGDRGDRRGGRLGRRQGRGPHRASAQTMDLPIISDLLKPGQEILLQIAKEPIAKKGARVTSHIALPGRFLVFMPTVNHVGVSRKIASDEERQRLKRILISEKGEASGGFIVRTAAEGASEDELRADLRFLINLWNDIKQREEASKAPALIYHDLNLVERVLRDQVSDNFSTIWVDSEAEYERIVRFLNRFQPSLVRRAKLYTKETPLFEQFGIQDEITKALRSKVWLKSGGSIVINQTEALVAIDINTGKYVGKTARLEDTILKTNLDAIPEIVRQIRLRDLGGIIVIDFIDMDERKNRHKVMAALEEALKADRAPSKVLQFNDFGLVAITRKRVKQSLERTLSVPCPVCTGTGMVKSPTTVANEIYIELRKMYRHLDRGDIMLRVNPEVVKVLKANNARWLVELEELSGKTIIVKSDPTLHPEQFDIH